MNLIYQLFPNLEKYQGELWVAFQATMRMLLVAGAFSFVLGLILGVVLVVTKKGGLLPQAVLYKVLDTVIDTLRAIPFIILITLCMPLSRAILGTGSGVVGAYVPLIVGTVPLFARQIETVLSDLDHGLIEASKAMGFSAFDIIFSVYLRESLGGIVRVTMITFVSLISMTAMAGAIGAGGLGEFAIAYGHRSRMTDLAILTVLIILAMISLFQCLGKFILKKTTH